MSFFSSSNQSGASAQQSNLLSYTAGDPDEATADEFRGALKATIAAMMAFKGDAGDPMSLSAAKLVCVVPTPIYFSDLEAVNATNRGQHVQRAGRSCHPPC